MSAARAATGPDKRRMILDAAVRVFARQGFHACRVSDIADEAGVAYGLVYHYFASKDEILDTLFLERWNVMLETIREVDAQADLGPREKLYEIASFIVDSYRHDPDLMKVIIVEVTRAANSFGQTHLAQIRQAYELIAEIVTAAQATGAFKAEIDAPFAAMSFYGAIEQMLTGWIFGLLPGGEDQYERAKWLVVETVCGGLENKQMIKKKTRRRPPWAIHSPDDGERDGQAADVVRHAHRLRRPREHPRAARRGRGCGEGCSTRSPPSERGAGRGPSEPAGAGGPRADRPQNIATAITDVSERVAVLVREEVELAKAEVTEKVAKLARGAMVGGSRRHLRRDRALPRADRLRVAALLRLPIGNDFTYFWGFFAMALILLVLGALAGLLAAKVDQKKRPAGADDGDRGGPPDPPDDEGGYSEQGARMARIRDMHVSGGRCVRSMSRGCRLQIE